MRFSTKQSTPERCAVTRNEQHCEILELVCNKQRNGHVIMQQVVKNLLVACWTVAAVAWRLPLLQLATPPSQSAMTVSYSGQSGSNSRNCGCATRTVGPKSGFVRLQTSCAGMFLQTKCIRSASFPPCTRSHEVVELDFGVVTAYLICYSQQCSRATFKYSHKTTNNQLWWHSLGIGCKWTAPSK